MLSLQKIIKETDTVNLVLSHKLVWLVLSAEGVLLVIFMEEIRKRILRSLKRIYGRRRRGFRTEIKMRKLGGSSRYRTVTKVEELLDLEEAVVQITAVAVVVNVDVREEDNHKENEIAFSNEYIITF